MRVTDLMVGDWVEDGYKKSQVTSITCDGIVETTSAISNIEVIEPIPLTEDILVKNGFDIEPCGCVWYQEHGICEQNYIVVSFYKNGEVRKIELSFVNKVHGEFRGIYTLHRLQHLLRLCGIEKEIEL